MHVLVATDGSQNSLGAARRAAELLRTADHVTVVTVISEVPGDDAGGIEGSTFSPEEIDTIWAQELADAREELERTAATLTNAQVDKRVELGDVSGTICRVAEELGVDVIVVGSHGRKGLERLFLGSTSEHVVRHAPCPVLVVREPHQRSS
jgi:nucleotide-binding universal stress UspA family protein